MAMFCIEYCSGIKNGIFFENRSITAGPPVR
nr:MAG TPA: hypothetical protein [Caudoviricetes sp.]